MCWRNKRKSPTYGKSDVLQYRSVEYIRQTCTVETPYISTSVEFDDRFVMREIGIDVTGIVRINAVPGSNKEQESRSRLVAERDQRAGA